MTTKEQSPDGETCWMCGIMLDQRGQSIRLDGNGDHVWLHIGCARDYAYQLACALFAEAQS